MYDDGRSMNGKDFGARPHVWSFGTAIVVMFLILVVLGLGTWRISSLLSEQVENMQATIAASADCKSKDAEIGFLNFKIGLLEKQLAANGAQPACQSISKYPKDYANKKDVEKIMSAVKNPQCKVRVVAPDRAKVKQDK